MNNLVSVIIPCYNQAQYLPDALESILAQSYRNWECIIINDGSTDNTEIVGHEWEKKDPRFCLITKSNGGLSSARNTGLAHMTGSYIQFLDADDVIHPQKFRLQLESISNPSNYAVSYCDYFPSTEKNLLEPTSKYLSPKFKTKNYLFELITRWEKNLSIPCHCFLFSSNIIKENSIRFDETLKNHEDWDFWMSIFRFKPEVSFVPLELATYRVHASSMSRNYKQMKIGFLKAISKQQRNFALLSIEYLLLTLKYFRVKLTINRHNKIIRFLIDQIKQIIRQSPKSMKMSL